jgi:hypothetical protein
VVRSSEGYRQEGLQMAHPSTHDGHLDNLSKKILFLFFIFSPPEAETMPCTGPYAVFIVRASAWHATRRAKRARRRRRDDGTEGMMMMGRVRLSPRERTIQKRRKERSFKHPFQNDIDYDIQTQLNKSISRGGDVNLFICAFFWMVSQTLLRRRDALRS